MEIINYDSERGGVSLEQEKTESGTTSRLLLTKATFSDNGNFTCVPMGALSASVIVHVLNGKQVFYYELKVVMFFLCFAGETPQAMQTSCAVHLASSFIFILFLAICNMFNLTCASQHITLQVNSKILIQR